MGEREFIEDAEEASPEEVKIEEEPKEIEELEETKKEDIESLRKKLEEKEKLAEEYLDHLQRLKAEFENYRKRIDRDRAEFTRITKGEILMDLLPVLDNFERALETGENSKDIKTVIEGEKLLFKMLKDVLAKEGLSRMECLGEEFDPIKHEAVSQMISAEHPDNTIIVEMQPGYILDNKILRYPKVIVSKKPEEEVNASSSEDYENRRNQ